MQMALDSTWLADPAVIPSSSSLLAFLPPAVQQVRQMLGPEGEDEDLPPVDPPPPEDPDAARHDVYDGYTRSRSTVPSNAHVAERLRTGQEIKVDPVDSEYVAALRLELVMKNGPAGIS